MLVVAVASTTPVAEVWLLVVAEAKNGAFRHLISSHRASLVGFPHQFAYLIPDITNNARRRWILNIRCVYSQNHSLSIGKCVAHPAFRGLPFFSAFNMAMRLSSCPSQVDHSPNLWIGFSYCEAGKFARAMIRAGFDLLRIGRSARQPTSARGCRRPRSFK